MEQVTVIIPTYNRSGFISGAVKSVITQSYPHIDLIIVDDGSTDDTREKVTGLSRQGSVPVRYIYQDNRGPSAARNTGIRAAQSDYICFLDSDDSFLPDKISLQLKRLTSTGMKISHTREIWYRDGVHLNQKKKHQPPEGAIFRNCLRMCVVGMSTVMVHRELFQQYGLFDESLPCCEDYDFWLRVSTGEQFHLVNTPLTRKDGGRQDQLSVIYRMGMDKFRIRSIANLLDSGSLSEKQSALAVDELKRKCRIYGNGCLKHGRTDEGAYYLQLPDKY